MSPSERQPRIALALAGGGLEGAVYEIGALRALEESLEGIDFERDVAIYVGVSAGAFIAACLANGLSTTQLVRSIVKQPGHQHPFVPETFFTPAAGEWLASASRVPGLLVDALVDYVRHPADLSLLESLTRLSRALPVGLFDNEPLRVFLERIFSLRGRTDDFRELRRRLVVVAAELDSGAAVRFGDPGLDDVPISKAVQASTALPGLYPPVRIGERYYVDGVLLKTLHASVALDAGAALTLCINPIVPVDTGDAVRAGVLESGTLVERGLPAVLSQTFRTLVHSRLDVGLSTYTPRYPGQDVVLIEPQRDDYRMFFTNIFSFSSRKAVAEHAYRSTRAQLLRRSGELEPLLARHGIRYRRDVLADPSRDLWRGAGLPPSRNNTSNLAEELEQTLTRVEHALERLSRRRLLPDGA